jgi:hypothetical protein
MDSTMRPGTEAVLSRGRRARPRLPRRALLLGCLGLALLPAAGAAQIVVDGASRSFQTDVTGPAVTSGDLAGGVLGPGSVKIFPCPVAWGVRTTSTGATAELGAGALRVALYEREGTVLPVEVQQRLYGVLVERDAAAGSALAAALAPQNNLAAQREARALVRRLDGLLVTGSRLHPARPDYRTTQQVAAAIGAFNRFIERSSESFLAAPPPEFAGVHAVLSRMVVAALENQGRTDFIVRPEGAGRDTPPELICAPPADEPPPPVIEHAIEICVLVHDQFQVVPAVYVPATGDTLALVEGARVPFNQVFPDTAAYARDQGWYLETETLTMGDRVYARFGLPFDARDRRLARIGDHQTVPLFIESGQRPPYRALFLLSGPRCEVVEYREREIIRRVRG